WTMLQNVFPGGDGREQSLALGLTLTKEYFRERGATGACRVHGGGFAGTILAVVPEVLYDEYRRVMDRAFGDHATKALTIRKEGVIVTSL
ncbi:MAG: galactokinase, partial [Alkalispirochaeta sp.]